MRLEMFKSVRGLSVMLGFLVLGCSEQSTEKESLDHFIGDIECEEGNLESWLNSSNFIGFMDGALNYTNDKKRVCLASTNLTTFQGKLNPVCIPFNVLEPEIYANEIVAAIEEALLSEDKDKVISPLQFSAHSDAVCAVILKEKTTYIVLQMENNSTLLAPISVQTSKRLKTKLARK